MRIRSVRLVLGVVCGVLLLGAVFFVSEVAGITVREACCQNGNFECQGCVDLGGHHFQMGSPLTPLCTANGVEEDTCEFITVKCFEADDVDYYSDDACSIYAGTCLYASLSYNGCDDPGSGSGCD